MITTLPKAPPASSQTYAQAIAPQSDQSNQVVTAVPQTYSPQTSAAPQGVTQTAATFPQPSTPPGTVFPQEAPIAERVVYQPVTSFPVNVFVPAVPGGWSFTGGVLFLRPSADNLGWGVVTTEKNFAGVLPIAQPYWNILSMNPGYSPGFEFGTSYTFANTGRDFQLNWQHMSMQAKDSASVTQTDGQWISPFCQTGPPTASDYQDMYALSGVNKLKSAEATVNFSYDNVNADFGQYVNFGAPLRLRMFAGLEYAALQERIVSKFYGLPPLSTATYPNNVPLVMQFDNQTSFSGVGPRMGFDSAYQMRRGFRLTGQVAGGLLIGQTKPSQYVLTATGPDLAAVGIPVNQEYIASKAFIHTVYAASAKLGIGYSRTMQNGITLFCDGGYMAALYVNPFSSYETNHNIIPLQSGSLSTGSVRHTLSNFAVDGMYLNAGLRW
jgi:hypothetical protein